MVRCLHVTVLSSIRQIFVVEIYAVTAGQALAALSPSIIIAALL